MAENKDGFKVAYTTFIDEDGNYQWIRLTKDGVGPEPATAKPFEGGIANPGTHMKYAREDHVHPNDITKQDLLYNPDGTLKVPLRTINGYKWWDIQDGGIIDILPKTQTIPIGPIGINKIESVSVNGNELPIDADKISTMKFKTVNGQSILDRYGSRGNIIIDTDYETIHFNDKKLVKFNGKKDLTVPVYTGAFTKTKS